MTEVQLHPSTGTRRLWNPIIAEYYSYQNRPTVNEDGRISVNDDCAERLVEQIPTMTLVEPEQEREDRSEVQTAEEREAAETYQDRGDEQ